MLLAMVLGGMCWTALGSGAVQQGGSSGSDMQVAHVREEANRAAPDASMAGPGKKEADASPGLVYRIGPEDLLQIEVFKEADFSAPAVVRTDGKISLPLLNDIQAAGLTPTELAGNLQEQLKQFLKEPKVTVVVSQMNSRKAYVMGMVNRQGIVRLQANSTILQALSAAGGLAPFANSKHIYVLRGDGQLQRKIPFNYDAVIKGKHPEQNILLEPGDTVVVP